MRHIRRIAAGPLALVLSAAVSAGCATKRDVRDLNAALYQLQARQDSLFHLLQRQNREVLDTVSRSSDMLVRVRGDIGHQLLDIEQQIVQLQELTGQSQRRLQELNAQMAQQRERLEQQQAAAGLDSTGAPIASPTAAGGASAADLYAIGREQLQNGAAQTARQAFQQLLSGFPTDTLAAAAQLGIAETYVLDKDYDKAMDAFERVAEMYPASPRAPAALYRAGVVEDERGNAKKAREYFQRVVNRYPQSDEAASAKKKLRSRER